MHKLTQFLPIFRADVLVELLSKPSVAAQSRCGAAVRGIHVSCLHDATSSAELLADDVDLYNATVFRRGLVCVICLRLINSLTLSSFSSHASHDRASSDGNGQENRDSHLVLPVLLHVSVWHLFSVFIRPHRTLCGALYRSCLLQSHGVPRYTRSHLPSGAETVHFLCALRAGIGRVDSAVANHDKLDVVSEPAVLGECERIQTLKLVEHLKVCETFFRS